MDNTNIMDTLTEKFNSNSGEDFNTNHRSFNENEFIKFLVIKEQQFMGNYRFEGDDNFTLAKQRIFLKLLFRYGTAGIINVKKLVENKLHKSVINAMEYLKFGVDDVVKNDDNYIPIAAFPYLWDNAERPVKGTGITAAIHNTNKKAYNITNKDTAMCVFHNNRFGGYWWWMVPAYIYATTTTVIKKRLTLLDGKLVQNNFNNSDIVPNYEGLYDPNSSFINITPGDASFTGNNAPNKINISSMLDQKIKKLDLSNGETINDLVVFLEQYMKQVLISQGIRTNTNEGKQERSISMDFESMEVHWRSVEQEFKDQLQMFMDDYEKTFGKKLKLVVLADVVREEMKQQEIEKAGRDKKDVEGKENNE